MAPVNTNPEPINRRRNAIICHGQTCPNCTTLTDARFRGLCRPYLWVTNISHLIMMLEMRIARSQHSESNSSESNSAAKGLLPLEKVDEVIAKDIDDVLSTGDISDMHKKDLALFLRKIVEAREILRGFEGFRYDDGLADVIGLMESWRRGAETW